MALSCGHEPSPHDTHTTGTAFTPKGREICWACADDAARDHMRRGRDTVGYMSQDGKAINTWSGGVLATVTSRNVRRVGFHSTERTYWKATDATGKHWYGSSAGFGMFTTMRRAKQPWRIPGLGAMASHEMASSMGLWTARRSVYVGSEVQLEKRASQLELDRNGPDRDKARRGRK